MAQPVYKFWTAKFTEAWYALSKEEQGELWKKNDESLKQVGAESLVYCGSLDEEWLGWGVEKYPSFEAAGQHRMNQLGINWYRYFEATSKYGVDMPPM